MIKLYLIALLALYTGYRLRDTLVTDDIDEEYDFIIVGGGTTGCALAGRLSEDQSIKILVIEAGESDLSFPSMRLSAAEPLIATSADWDYRTVPQKYGAQSLVGKIDRWPRGKILGGTSSLNHLIYNRGSPHDFDSWEDHGAKGWSWKDVEPFFKKAEGADDTSLSKKLGKDGPVHLKRAHTPTILKGLFEEAAVDSGINKVDYIDDPEGISDITSTLEGGLRVNSVEAYLRGHFPNQKNRIHVTVGSYATKILFDGDKELPRATGVTFVKNGKETTVRARKEIIISAGIVETPHLLMLSGIGPRNHLDEHGIPLVADLQGVGSNLEDHLRMIYHVYSNEFPEETRVPFDTIKPLEGSYVAKGTGPPTFSSLSTIIHYKTKLSGTTVSTSSTERPFPEILIALYPFETSLRDYESSEEATTYKISDFLPEVTKAITQRGGVISSFIVVVGLEHAKSRGTIRLNSSDPFDRPLIDPAFLSDEDDILVYIEGLRKTEEILNAEAFKKYNAKEVFQPYCKDKDTGFPRSEEYYRCWLRETAVTLRHPCCSAKMGNKSDKGAVVDERLRVYGVKGLRVADASVMPHEVSGNIQAACYMIAEKAAHMIMQDWSP